MGTAAEESGGSGSGSGSGAEAACPGAVAGAPSPASCKSGDRQLQERLEQCAADSTSSDSLATVTVYNLSDGDNAQGEADTHQPAGGAAEAEQASLAAGGQGSSATAATGAGAAAADGQAPSAAASDASGSLNPVLVAAVDAVEFKPKPKALNALAADFVPGAAPVPQAKEGEASEGLEAGAAEDPYSSGHAPFAFGSSQTFGSPPCKATHHLGLQMVFGEGFGDFSQWSAQGFGGNGFCGTQQFMGDFGSSGMYPMPPFALPVFGSGPGGKGGKARSGRGSQGRLGAAHQPGGQLRPPGQLHPGRSAPPLYPPEAELEAAAAVLAQQFPELDPRRLRALLHRERSLPAVLNLLAEGGAAAALLPSHPHGGGAGALEHAQQAQRSVQEPLPALTEENFPTLAAAASLRRSGSSSSTPTPRKGGAATTPGGEGSSSGSSGRGLSATRAPLSPHGSWGSCPSSAAAGPANGHAASAGGASASAKERRAGGAPRERPQQQQCAAAEAQALRRSLFTSAPLPPEANLHKARLEARQQQPQPHPQLPQPQQQQQQHGAGAGTSSSSGCGSGVNGLGGAAPKGSSPAAPKRSGPPAPKGAKGAGTPQKGFSTPKKAGAAAAAPAGGAGAAAAPASPQGEGGSSGSGSPAGGSKGSSASPGGSTSYQTPPAAEKAPGKGSKRGPRLAVPVGQPYVPGGPQGEGDELAEGDSTRADSLLQTRRRKRNTFFEQAKRAYLRGDLELAYELGRLGRCEAEASPEGTPEGTPPPSGSTTPVKVVDLLMKQTGEAVALAKRELASTRSAPSALSSPLSTNGSTGGGGGGGADALRCPGPSPQGPLSWGHSPRLADPKRLFFACGLGSPKSKGAARVPDALEALFASEGLTVLRPHPGALEVHVY